MPESPIMEWFAYAHLPDPHRGVSELCFQLAKKMEDMLGTGPEKSAGLRHLLEAKDCFVRQAIKDERERRAREQPSPIDHEPS